MLPRRSLGRLRAPGIARPPRAVLLAVTGAVLAVSAPPAEAEAQAAHDLLVSSRNTNSVKRFDGDTGEYVDDFVAEGAGGLEATQEVALGPDGAVYVSGRGNTGILRFDARTGRLLGTFTRGYALDEPTKITFGPDDLLYVSQWGEETPRVARFDAESGEFVDEVTEDLEQPMDHAWDGDGNLYVAVFGSREVRKYGPDGGSMGTFAEEGVLGGPVNLWFDEAGDLLVVDWPQGAVHRFDGVSGVHEGTLLSGLQRAEGFTFGPGGDLYLADWQANEIHRFDPETGESMGVFAQGGGLRQPNGLVFVERLPDFRLEIDPAEATVDAGDDATFTLSVAGHRGPFEEAVSLECSEVTAGASCAFSPPTVTPGEGSATSTLVVSTGSVTASGSTRGGVRFGLAAGLLGLPLVLGGLGGSRRRRALRRLAAAGLLLALVATLGCGGVSDGGSPTTPEGPDTRRLGLTVTATGGGVSHSASANVTVRFR